MPGHRIGHRDLGQPVDLRIDDAGERNCGQLANPAAGAVAAHEVAGGDPIGAVRAPHVGGDRVGALRHVQHLMSAPDVDAEFIGAFAEHPLELLLRQRQGVHRRLGEPGEVHMDTAEREPRSRYRVGAGRFEPVQQAPVAQQLENLPAEPTGLRSVAGSRLPFQHQRPDSGRLQFGGQHQTGRARAHDDHVGMHSTPVPAVSGRSNDSDIRHCRPLPGPVPAVPGPPALGIGDCARRHGTCDEAPLVGLGREGGVVLSHIVTASGVVL